MKKIMCFICFSLLLLNCNNGTKESNVKDVSDTDSETALTLEGVWELTGYYNYLNNKVTDSFDTNSGSRQVKMYTPTRVMWSKSVPADSTEWFGYGSYKVVDGELTEVLDYGSAMMSRIIEEQKEFTYELILEPKKFTQIEIDEDGNRIYSENYTRIE